MYQVIHASSLLRNCCVPGTVLGVGNIPKNEIKFMLSWRKINKSTLVYKMVKIPQKKR